MSKIKKMAIPLLSQDRATGQDEQAGTTAIMEAAKSPDPASMSPLKRWYSMRTVK